MNGLTKGAARRHLNPRKLLHSKWTARRPQQREKHFLVTRLIVDEVQPEAPPEQVIIEAVYSGREQLIHWRALLDESVWQQGWR